MAREASPLRFLPYPELVEPPTAFGDAPAPFRIEDSRHGDGSVTGAVDLVERRMLVPLDAWSRATMRHELGHVRWSPQRPPRVRFDRRVAAAVEDARVNLALAAGGVPVALGMEDGLHVAWLLAADQQRGDVFAVWLRAIAAIGTSAEDTLQALLLRWRDGDGAHVVARMQRIRERLEDARRESGAEVAPERRGRALARELARVLRAEGVLDARGQAIRTEFAIDCCTVHAEKPGGAAPPAHRRREDGRAGSDEEQVEPGRMTITRAALPRARSGGRGLRGWCAAREGSVVRYATRWAHDRAIFRKPARSARGTLLIDASGSMKLDAAKLDAMLASTRPGLVVAVYCGSGDDGELRVVAQGPQRARDAELKPPGNGNIVDLPALQWLARQPGPRVWVSDGHVTGKGDKASARLRRECEALCCRAGIRRAEKLDDATEALRPSPGR